MKKITLFLFTLLISCSVLGALPKKTVLYLNASSWGYGDAEFIAYFCDGTSGTKWLKMDKVENGYYKCTTPDGDYKNVLFLRVNPTHTNVKDKNTGTSWPGDAVWNQTNNLTFTEANNIYVKTGWGNSDGWWSTILEPNTEIYFAKTDADWVNSSASLLIGHDTYSEAYSLTNIEGTNLFYKKITNKWEGYKEWIVINEKWDGGEGKIISERTKNVSKKIDVNKNLLTLCHLINGSSNEKISSYSSLNYSQTINSGANGTVTAESYKLTSANGTTKQEATAQASSKTTLSAALTATLTLTPTANPGYHFDKWNDNNAENPREVTIKSNATYTAIFAINTYTVSVSANNAEWGTVSGDSTYNHGATATLTATPNDGYKFVKWNDGNTNNPRTITVTSNATYTATFEKLEDVEFSNPSILTIGETYGKLSYRLTMQDNRWYWIVLPYNVNVSEIETSTNGGWNDLVFTEYDAQRRAEGKNGWINWKTEYTDKGDSVPTQLQANKGYVIGPKNEPYKQDGDFVVTFPSVSTTNTVTDTAKLTTTEAIGSNEKDNNWHIIGTGLYHNASLEGINYVALPAVVNGKDSYEYKYITSRKEPFFTNQIDTNSFAPFEAFFVQYGGTYSATATDAQSAALAPVARAKAQEQEQIYLINMNEAHTVVILNAEGSEGYTAGEDFLEMNVGSRIEMIYSFDAEDALAFNHRATEAQSIALGGYVAVAGEQTISLDAYNGNAEAVTLIDNVTGTTTDLLAEDYTFTAEVGSLDGRFTIVFAAQKAGSDTTVDCYNSIANQVIAYGTADHCTVSGLTAGEAIVVYNTMGQLVFATTADSETITLPSLTAGNYLILHNGTTNKVTLR